VTAPVAIFAVGNRSRGDDAVAPLLLDRLRAWLAEQGVAGGFDLFEEYQLQVENALDIEGRHLVLFIDAQRDADAPVRFEPVPEAAALSGHSSHALAPGAVLGVYRQVTGASPPPAFVLGIAATHFELGAPISAATRDSMEEGWVVLRSLCRHPRGEDWRAARSARAALQPIAEHSSAFPVS
jgi:hydrogenase maturation protease